MAAILRNGVQECGGSLIANGVVLTAAHCLAGVAGRWENFSVVLGETEIAFGTKIGVRDVISHSDHGGSSQDANDIALVFLDKCGTVPAEGTIGLAEFCTWSDRPGVMGLIMGWGNSVGFRNDEATLSCRDRCDACYYNSYADAECSECFACTECSSVACTASVLAEACVTCVKRFFQGHDVHYPDRLQTATVPIISNDECSSAMHNIIAETMVCAGGGRQDACQGDSGGPLVVPQRAGPDWLQVGVSSFGEGCARIGRYGVYTRLSSFERWIRTRRSNRACDSTWPSQLRFDDCRKNYATPDSALATRRSDAMLGLATALVAASLSVILQ